MRLFRGLQGDGSFAIVVHPIVNRQRVRSGIEEKRDALAVEHLRHVASVDFQRHGDGRCRRAAVADDDQLRGLGRTRARPAENTVVGDVGSLRDLHRLAGAAGKKGQ